MILVVLFLGAFVGLGMLAAPRITAQWQDLRTQLPAALSRVESWVKERQGGVVSMLTQPDSTSGQPKAAELMEATGMSLRRWLVAQFIGMVVIGAITTVALLLLDVRAAVALGIIAGIFEFIPYFGPIMSAVPAIAMGFLDGPEKALWVAVAYVAIQQIEGNLLMPYLMQEGLDLPPVLTILGQAVLALVFGFIGLVIAMPLLGAVLVPIKLLYVQDVVGDDVALPGDDGG